MKEVVADPDLVAYCGLYCGACRRYLKGGCPGCHENERASWCRVRSCCIDAGLSSCAGCEEHDDPARCSRYNTFLARLIGLILRSDRRACILQIKELGIDGHARDMAASGRQTIKPGTRS